MSLVLPGPYKGLRIGLFGGTFNPAHSGHRHLALLALHVLADLAVSFRRQVVDNLEDTASDADRTSAGTK